MLQSLFALQLIPICSCCDPHFCVDKHSWRYLGFSVHVFARRLSWVWLWFFQPKTVTVIIWHSFLSWLLQPRHKSLKYFQVLNVLCFTACLHVLTLQILELSSNLRRILVRSSLFCKQHLLCWCMLGGSVWVWTKYILYWLISACQELLKCVWLSMNRNRLLSIQIQTLPPRTHLHKGKLWLILFAQKKRENL